MRFLSSVCMLHMISAHNGFTSITDCSTASSIGHIRKLSLEPAAPISGEWVMVSIEYDLDTDVTDGVASYSASYNGFPLTPTTEPLCPDFAKTTPCPISAGPVYYQNMIQMGDGTIHGTVSTTTKWSDQFNFQILCWGFTVRI